MKGENLALNLTITTRQSLRGNRDMEDSRPEFPIFVLWEHSFVNMCIRVYDQNGFGANILKAAAIALLHIILPMWIVVILRSKWLTVLHLVWISVCIGGMLYGMRLLFRLPLEDMQVPFMESCDVRVWPHCIFVVEAVILVWGLLGMSIMHGNFWHFVLLMIFLLFGEVLIRSIIWYTGTIPSFLMNGNDLHEPLNTGLPPGSDINAGNYHPPI